MVSGDMKNITIKLDDDIAHWAKLWAAEKNTSVSQMVSELLVELHQEKTGYKMAMMNYLSVKNDNISQGQEYPSRDQLYER